MGVAARGRVQQQQLRRTMESLLQQTWLLALQAYECFQAALARVLAERRPLP